VRSFRKVRSANGKVSDATWSGVAEASRSDEVRCCRRSEIKRAMTRRKIVAAFAALAVLSHTAIAIAGDTTGSVRAGMDLKTASFSVTLEPGTGSTVMLERPYKTVLLGNPDVIEVQTLDERSVLLKPLSPGSTNLVFVDERGIVITNLAILVRTARAT
jgi:Flp pilus assembly secretin CpaC